LLSAFYLLLVSIEEKCEVICAAAKGSESDNQPDVYISENVELYENMRRASG
jgi:hypothetical protein